MESSVSIPATNSRAADAQRLRATLALHPGDRVAWHNLAAAEGDLGHAAQAEVAARRAIALGIDAPETRLVLARALQALRKLDDAEAMFKKAIALRPAYADAHRDLAQLIWMRTGDAQAALQRLTRALRDALREPICTWCGRSYWNLPANWRLHSPRRTKDWLRPARRPPPRHAAHLCARSAMPLGRCRCRSRPSRSRRPTPPRKSSLCESLLAAGRCAEAEANATALCTALPTNQYVTTLRATAWRLMGDARYSTLYELRRAEWPSSGSTPPDLRVSTHS